jgi:hypothetical protein
MADTSELDLRWDAADVETARLPRDRVAVASVVLSSLWLWWVGSVAGLVLGIVALRRAPAQPHPYTSRRWAWAGIVTGLIGVLTFSLFVAPILFPALGRRFADSEARATLADLSSTVAPGSANGFADAAAGANPWTLPGHPDVTVVGPGVPSADAKTVSTEVWGAGQGKPGTGVAVYAAVLSKSGTCFFLRQTATAQYASAGETLGACTADQARTVGPWS